MAYVVIPAKAGIQRQTGYVRAIMDKTSSNWRSKRELKRLVEEAVREECSLARGLWFSVDEIETRGNPVGKIRVWATLHFTSEGSPYCCGEPECHLDLIRKSEPVADRIQLQMNLKQSVELEMVGVAVSYHDGVEFTRS